MLLRNARVAGVTGAVDVRIDGGVITEIGPDLPGDGIDLAGRWVSPGLWDEHVHMSQWALVSRRLDLSGAASATEVAELVRSALESSDADPFVGSGFRDGLWPDAPTRPLLDQVSDRPVVLVSGDLHSTWLNSAALALYGFESDSGLLREDDAFEVTRLVNTVPDDRLDAWVAEAGRAAAARGVVGFVDLEMAWNLDAWERRVASGFDTQRVEFGVYSEDLDRAIDLGFFTGMRVSDLVTVGRFKVLIDGSLNTRTAYCYDDYPGTPGAHGMLTVAHDELATLMRKANAAGIEPTVHAIGDRAVTLALDALETVGCRGRIEHAQLVAPADLPRFGALDVIASVQPDHAMDDREVAELYWPGRTGNAFALRSLLDAGATLAFGSDAPVSALDPWRTADAAMTRSRGGREPWHPEQRVTPAEALAASTRSTVEVGQPADLVVTESNPLDGFAGVTVAATLLAGRFTHTAL